jgi:hypothetical protein
MLCLQFLPSNLSDHYRTWLVYERHVTAQDIVLGDWTSSELIRSIDHAPLQFWRYYFIPHGEEVRARNILIRRVVELISESDNGMVRHLGSPGESFIHWQVREGKLCVALRFKGHEVAL